MLANTTAPVPVNCFSITIMTNCKTKLLRVQAICKGFFLSYETNYRSSLTNMNQGECQTKEDERDSSITSYKIIIWKAQGVPQ